MSFEQIIHSTKDILDSFEAEVSKVRRDVSEIEELEIDDMPVPESGLEYGGILTDVYNLIYPLYESCGSESRILDQIEASDALVASFEKFKNSVKGLSIEAIEKEWESVKSASNFTIHGDDAVSLTLDIRTSSTLEEAWEGTVSEDADESIMERMEMMTYNCEEGYDEEYMESSDFIYFLNNWENDMTDLMNDIVSIFEIFEQLSNDLESLSDRV